MSTEAFSGFHYPPSGPVEVFFAPASTGRVYIKRPGQDNLHAQGFFPSVINAGWIEREDQS